MKKELRKEEKIRESGVSFVFWNMKKKSGSPIIDKETIDILITLSPEVIYKGERFGAYFIGMPSKIIIHCIEDDTLRRNIRRALEFVLIDDIVFRGSIDELGCTTVFVVLHDKREEFLCLLEDISVVDEKC